MYISHLTHIIRKDDGAVIPLDINNSDYANYLVWLDEGNTPEPAETPALVKVATVGMAQARLALLHAGYLSTVNSAIAEMAGVEGDAARIEWEFRTTIERNSSLVSVMSYVLSLNDLQLDGLFTDASNL